MSIDKFFKFLVPKDTVFFPLFEKDAENLVAIAEVLHELFKYNDLAKREELIKKIKELEHKGDEITHTIFESLNKSFITPFDREDIHELTATMDDVADFINKTAQRVRLYNPKKFIPEYLKITELILEAAKQIQIAIGDLKLTNDHEVIKETCVKLNSIENQADDLYHYAIQQLFELEKDTVELIKNKEILESLEKATDKAEDVSDVLKTIIIKMA